MNKLKWNSYKDSKPPEYSFVVVASPNRDFEGYILNACAVAPPTMYKDTYHLVPLQYHNTTRTLLLDDTDIEWWIPLNEFETTLP